MTKMSLPTTLAKALLVTSLSATTANANATVTATASAQAASPTFVVRGASARGVISGPASASHSTLSFRGSGPLLAAATLRAGTRIISGQRASSGKSSGRCNSGSGGAAAVGATAATSPGGQDLAVGVSEMAEGEKLPVVSVDWLHEHLNDSDLKVLDASWYMPADKRNPLQEYKEGHISGSLFFDVDAIVDPTSEMPHMLPSQAAFSAAASALGLHNDDKIVVYDGKGIFSAARVWWMFRVFGHEKVWVLDGGLPQWLRQNHHVQSAASPIALEKLTAASEAIKKIYGGKHVDSGVFKAHLQKNLVLSLDEVKQNIAEKKYLLVDARSKARFDGSAPEPRKGVKGGHVPGSTCVPFPEVLTSTGTLLPADYLAGKFQHAGVALDSPVAVSCGTGVTACILALALYRLGKTDIPVYDGSWTEWGLAPNVPVETNV